MATITRIIETERENYDRIHLFREGLFYKAHQHSAFMFNTRIKSFKTVKKFYKAAGCDVVMLGFPSKMLSGLFPEEIVIEEIEDGHISIPCSPHIDLEAYGQWFDSIQYAPEKKKGSKPVAENDSFSLNFDIQLPSTLGDTQHKVLRDLESFDVGNATPIECMVFIGKLKSDLKRGVSGSV